MSTLKPFKLHGLPTVEGRSASSQNGVFYETYEEAFDQARKYVSQKGVPIVIFRAIAVVEAAAPPVTCTPVQEDGTYGKVYY